MAKPDDKRKTNTPPKHTQFGQPGVNNKGGGRKPKQKKTEPASFDDLISEEIVVNGANGPITMTMLEAAQRAFISKGLNGSPLDAKRVLDKMESGFSEAQLSKRRETEIRQEVHQEIGKEMRASGDSTIEKLTQMRKRYLEGIANMEKAEVAILDEYPEVLGKLSALWGANRYARETPLQVQIKRVGGLPDERSLAEYFSEDGGLMTAEELAEEKAKEALSNDPAHKAARWERQKKEAEIVGNCENCGDLLLPLWKESQDNPLLAGTATNLQRAIFEALRAQQASED